MPLDKPVIFVLGLGSIGGLLASNLQQEACAEVIPLLRSREKVAAFKTQKSKIEIRSLFKEGHPLTAVEFSHVSCPETFEEDVSVWISGRQIDNLVITTKTYQTKDALKPYLKFMHPKTNIILIQNGLGVLEVLKRDVFLEFHPNLYQGVISHGIFQDMDTHETTFNQNESIVFNHAGFGSLQIAKLPWSADEMVQRISLIEKERESNLLLKALITDSMIHSLNVTHITYQEMLLAQLEKYLINACINPVTAILDCINGEIDEIAGPLFDAIINESLDVLRVAYKPLFEYELLDLQNIPKLNVEEKLSPRRVLNTVMDIGCKLNSANSSSMRQDVAHLRDTEVSYINGYIDQIRIEYDLPSSSSKVNKTIEALVNLRLGLNRSREKN